MEWFRLVVDVVASLGLFINSLLFIPQAIKILREKNSENFSRTTFVGFCVTQFAAILYGYAFDDQVLFIGYILSLISCGFVTILIFAYGKNKHRGVEHA